MSKTIFEQIIDREIPAQIIYETDEVIAFLDAFPIVKGHALVVPKKPIENIYELDEDTGKHVISAVTKVANAVKQAFQPDGLNVVQNNGEFASQSVFHLHFHILPRYRDEHDGFDYRWESIPEKQSDEEREALKDAIISKLNA